MTLPDHTSGRSKSVSDVLKGLPPEDFSLRNASTGLRGLAHKVHHNLQDYGRDITGQKTLAYLVRPAYFRQV
jgi:hypothetical protein